MISSGTGHPQISFPLSLRSQLQGNRHQGLGFRYAMFCRSSPQRALQEHLMGGGFQHPHLWGPAGSNSGVSQGLLLSGGGVGAGRCTASDMHTYELSGAGRGEASLACCRCTAQGVLGCPWQLASSQTFGQGGGDKAHCWATPACLCASLRWTSATTPVCLCVGLG